MTSVLTIAWLEARRTATQTAIVAYEDAILALASGAQQYTLDTGQTRVTKTQANLSEMRRMLSELEQRLEGLDARLEGSVVYHGRPAH